MQDKFLLFKSTKNPNKYTLITEKDKGLEDTKTILTMISESKNKLETTQINFKKGRYVVLKNFIEDIKKDPNLKLIMDNIHFSFQN